MRGFVTGAESKEGGTNKFVQFAMLLTWFLQSTTLRMNFPFPTRSAQVSSQADLPHRDSSPSLLIPFPLQFGLHQLHTSICTIGCWLVSLGGVLFLSLLQPPSSVHPPSRGIGAKRNLATRSTDAEVSRGGWRERRPGAFSVLQSWSSKPKCSKDGAFSHAYHLLTVT